MQITEIFHSLQGEGPDTGKPTVFVRTAGCNLRCAWCDTSYSFGEGTPMSVEEIVAKVRTYPVRNVCLTGGEPLLQKDAPELIRALSDAGYTTVIETGGSMDISPYLDIPRAVISLDVKCPSSAMEGRNRRENLPLLRATDTVKFVVADRKDYEFARRMVAEAHFPCAVVFQPVWGRDASELAGWVLADGLDVRMMLQQHKHIWGDVPGR